MLIFRSQQHPFTQDIYALAKWFHHRQAFFLPHILLAIASMGSLIESPFKIPIPIGDCWIALRYFQDRTHRLLEGLQSFDLFSSLYSGQSSQYCFCGSYVFLWLWIKIFYDFHVIEPGSFSKMLCIGMRAVLATWDPYWPQWHVLLPMRLRGEDSTQIRLVVGKWNYCQKLYANCQVRSILLSSQEPTNIRHLNTKA
jgi:hypothetical protein